MSTRSDLCTKNGHRRRLVGFCALAQIAALLFLLSLGGSSAAGAQPAGTDAGNVPVLAYYYVWFNPTSWQRAKIDYPLLGRYSSDEREVMRQHIKWAKQAGINGFIVSWKSTETLNRRLSRLIQVAEAEHFKLALIYQGLDFNRRPLPPERIAQDLDLFTKHYAKSKVFRTFGKKPVVIWSGTWRFSHDQVSSVTSSRRDRLLILASEKDAAGYGRLADVVDGNGYYWSSVNPDTHPDYVGRLRGMGDVVHARKGLWIAPAAPGFDARLVGGTSMVDRKNGDTLRREYDAALSSSPDAIGLISWNEFSENSHIEPSQRYGARYLQVFADIRGARAPRVDVFDSSSEPATSAKGYGPVVLGAFVLLIIAGIFIVLRRRPHREQRRDRRDRPLEDRS
jgi:glycosyl hydrolase family 99